MDIYVFVLSLSLQDLLVLFSKDGGPFKQMQNEGKHYAFKRSYPSEFVA